MGDIIGKLTAVLLAFVLLAIAPVTIMVLSQNIRTERMTWNLLTNFTDIVSDKGVLLQSDYEQFITALGATGVHYEVIINVQHKMILPHPIYPDSFTVRYVTSGLWRSSHGGVVGVTYLEAGDNLQVVLQPISHTRGDDLFRGLFGLHMPRQSISYASNVRNSGR